MYTLPGGVFTCLRIAGAGDKRAVRSVRARWEADGCNIRLIEEFR
jgi:hypothetical protein